MNRYQEPITIPTLKESLSHIVCIPDAIRLIRKEEKIGHTQLARSLGVSRISIYHWEKGERFPKEPLIVLCISSWAERIKNRAS